MPSYLIYSFPWQQGIAPKRKLAYLCQSYLSSFPCPHINAFHSSAANPRTPDPAYTLAHVYLSGTYSLSSSGVASLSALLQYRLRLIATATRYKNLLGLNMLDCDQFDLRAWKGTPYMRYRILTRDDTFVRGTFELYCAEIARSGLFPSFEGTGEEGSGMVVDEFRKPEMYLAATFLDNELDGEEVKFAVNVLTEIENRRRFSMLNILFYKRLCQAATSKIRGFLRGIFNAEGEPQKLRLAWFASTKDRVGRLRHRDPHYPAFENSYEDYENMEANRWTSCDFSALRRLFGSRSPKFRLGQLDGRLMEGE